MDWRHDAVCRDENPELFFPAGNTGPALLQIAEAKAVCRRCPVASECLAWALESGQDAGVWGGMSEDERRALRRKKATPVSTPRRGHAEIVTDELHAEVLRRTSKRESIDTISRDLGIGRALARRLRVGAAV